MPTAPKSSDGQPARRRHRTAPIVLLPAVQVPLTAEHEQLALAALGELLAPLFRSPATADVETGLAEEPLPDD